MPGNEKRQAEREQQKTLPKERGKEEREFPAKGKKIGSDIRRYPSRKTAADPAIRSKIERKVSRQDSSPFFYVTTF